MESFRANLCQDILNFLHRSSHNHPEAGSLVLCYDCNTENFFVSVGNSMGRRVFKGATSPVVRNLEGHGET